MTNTATGAVIDSRPRNAYPGDTVRIMRRPHEDAAGTAWPAGTEYQPQSQGADNAAESGDVIQTVTIGGATVRFRTLA